MDQAEFAPLTRISAEQVRGWVVLALTVGLVVKSAWDGDDPLDLLALLWQVAAW